MAEGVGFEPTVSFPTSVFKTDAIDHSATPPVRGSRTDDYPHSPDFTRKTSYFPGKGAEWMRAFWARIWISIGSKSKERSDHSRAFARSPLEKKISAMVSIYAPLEGFALSATRSWASASSSRRPALAASQAAVLRVLSHAG